jgi:hypothetical protein
MIMADVLTWFLIIVGSLMVFIAHWLGAFALFPALVEGCSERYGRRPVAATLLGLVVLVPTLVAATLITKKFAHPVIGTLVVALLSIPTLLAMLGSAGLALRIGAGLRSQSDTEQPWRRVLRGGTVLSLVFVLPVLGWFVMLPWALASGFGAALMTLLAERRPASALLAPTTEPQA